MATKAEDTKRMLDAVVAAKTALLYRLRNELKGFNSLDDEEQEAILINLANKDFDSFKSVVTSETSYITESYTRSFRSAMSEFGFKTED